MQNYRDDLVTYIDIDNIYSMGFDVFIPILEPSRYFKDDEFIIGLELVTNFDHDEFVALKQYSDVEEDRIESERVNLTDSEIRVIRGILESIEL